MAETTNSAVLDTYGATALSTSTVDQLIEDAAAEVDIRWSSDLTGIDVSNFNDISASSELVERAERLLACHFMKDAEPEMDSASGEGQSVSVSIPSGSVDEWLQNTTHGRSLLRFLSALDITVDESLGSLPKNYG